MSEQRELKFRARMADPGVHEGIFVYLRGLQGTWTSKNGTYYGEIVTGSEEQCTGLHDSKGVEIFEGDILLYTPQKWTGTEGKYEYDDNERLIAVPRNIYIDMEPVQRGPVSWDETGGWFPFADNDDGMPYPDALRCEVIGNVHENPELRE